MESRTLSRPIDKSRRRYFACVLTLLILLAMLALRSSLANETRSLTVALYKSTTLLLSKPAKRISVGNPGVADVVILRNNEVQVVGKALGATNLVAWDGKGRVMVTYNVEVVHDQTTLKEKLHQLLPGEAIKVQSAQENIVLSGEVKNLSMMQAAIALAEGFIPECIDASSTQGEGAEGAQSSGGQQAGCGKGSVINLMQVGGAQQIMLEIKVAEIARTVLKSMDADVNIFNLGKRGGIGALQGGASFPDAGGPIFTGPGGPVGPNVDLFAPATPTIDKSGIFLSYLKGDLFMQAVLEISRRKGLAKILSEPTVTTLNGQEAEFLSGGEFPIPVPQGGSNNSTTIEFKEFGVGVKFLPVVLDSGRINLKLNVSVSELSQDNTVTLAPGAGSNVFVIPSLSKRSAKSTVELADGQTIGIAGLISDNTREFVDKLPGLGDIPGLGMLFRSQEFRSGQTELVIFVTPHLARPINPANISLPTDSFVPANDREFYLMGRMEASKGKKSKAKASPESSKGGAEGASFGHDL